MIIQNKKFIFFSSLTAILILAGILGLAFFKIPEGQAIDMGDEGPECFYSADCDAPYDYCTYGFGFSSCTENNECANCGSSVGANYRCYNSSYCQVQIVGNWLPCGMCYDVQDPPPPPPPNQCYIDAEDFTNALYIKSPNGTTQFAITDGGHLLTVNGNGNVQTDWAGFLDMVYDPDTNNNFPIYNGNTLIAFFYADNDSNNAILYLGGSIHEFEVNLTSPEPGSFVIKNSADMVVAYIDPDGDLYLMGCLDDNGYNF